MKLAQHRFEVATKGQGLYEITAEAAGWIATEQFTRGLLTMFLPHTSASLIIQENADRAVRHDLEAFFKRLVPEDARLYRHREEGEDDMPAHIRAALTQVQLVIPIAAGRLALGTWQGIYLFEHRHAPHRREIHLTAIGE